MPVHWRCPFPLLHLFNWDRQLNSKLLERELFCLRFLSAELPFPEGMAKPGLLHLSVLPSASGSAVEVESVSPVVDELYLSPESMKGASASSESESSPLASQKMRLRPFSSFLTDPPRHLLDKRLIDPGLSRSLWWPLRSLRKLPFFHSHPR